MREHGAFEKETGESFEREEHRDAVFDDHVLRAGVLRVALAVQAKVTQEFNTAYLMVIAFYFGTQNGKNAREET